MIVSPNAPIAPVKVHQKKRSGIMKDVGTEKLGLGDEAYARIKEDIVWCQLQPGMEVSEASLAEMYGFGKAPIRSALARLSQEKYIVSQPRRRHVIAPLTLKVVRELFEWRLIVETAVVEMACGKVDCERLTELDMACAAGYVPGDIASEKRFVAANKAFHLEIAMASGNSRLVTAFDQILDEMTRLLHLSYVLRERTNQSAEQHAALIKGLAQGDVEAVRRISRSHIESVRADVIYGITQYSSLNEMNISLLS